jgi:hypothetical protein
MGLKKNRSLKVLKIEHQKLGLQGASTLASVLEGNNSLLEVYCDNNEINLQSFTVLVKGLRQNKNILHVPPMTHDREQSLARIRRELETMSREPVHSTLSRASSFRRSIQAAVIAAANSRGNKLTKPQPAASMPSRGSHATTITSPLASSPSILVSSISPPHFIRPDVQALLQSLDQRWDAEVHRMQQYLVRNYKLAHGLVEEGDVDDNIRVDCDDACGGQPTIAASLGNFPSRLAFEALPSGHGAQVVSEAETKSDKPANCSSDAGSSLRINRRQRPDREAQHKVQTKDIEIDGRSAISFQSLPTPLRDASSPSSTFTAASSSHLSLVLASFPRSVSSLGGSSKTNSVTVSRSTSKGTGRGALTRTGSGGVTFWLGDAALSLRSLLSGSRTAETREKRYSKDGGEVVAATFSQPPLLDWALPDLKV